MVIAEIIREAETEYVVYFLLQAYLDAKSRREALKTLPARITESPVSGKQDAQARYALLQAELVMATRRRDEKTSAAIKEALMVFGAALLRLQALEAQAVPTAVAGAAISQSS